MSRTGSEFKISGEVNEARDHSLDYLNFCSFGTQTLDGKVVSSRETPVESVHGLLESTGYLRADYFPFLKILGRGRLRPDKRK